MTHIEKAGKTIDVLFSAEEIANRNLELVREIAEMDPHRLLVIAVLKGSYVFAADLIRAMHEVGLAPEVDFIHLSSYREATVSTGHVRVVRDIESEVGDRDVIIIDEILESGRTLAYAKDLIAARGARRVKTCVLLVKPGRQTTQIQADFQGFECPDRFVVGYGMDMGNAFRELPFVGYIVGPSDDEPKS
ncbi:MAG: hypoxanthine phosphoribosyltransferase [Pseudomonadota bacterium]